MLESANLPDRVHDSDTLIILGSSRQAETGGIGISFNTNKDGEHEIVGIRPGGPADSSNQVYPKHKTRPVSGEISYYRNLLSKPTVETLNPSP